MKISSAVRVIILIIYNEKVHNEPAQDRTSKLNSVPSKHSDQPGHHFIQVKAVTIHSHYMGESSKFPKSWTLENQNLKLTVFVQIIKNSKFNIQIPLDKLKLNQKSYSYLQNSGVWGWLSMESQPQNPEFRNNPENFHPCTQWLAKNSMDSPCRQQRLWSLIDGFISVSQIDSI